MEPLEGICLLNDDDSRYTEAPMRKQPMLSMQERVTQLLKEATSNLQNEKDQLNRFQEAAGISSKNIIKYEIQLAALVTFQTAAAVAEETYANSMNPKQAVETPGIARRIDMD